MILLDNKNDKVLQLNRGSSYERNVEARKDVCLIKLGLHIPYRVKSYDEFVAQIRYSEDDFVLRIKRMVD